MSLAEIEVVMDGNKPRRVILTGADGAPVEVPGVVDIAVDIPNHDVTTVVLRIAANISVRQILEEER